MRSEKFARVLLWIGGILIVVAIVVKLIPATRSSGWPGATLSLAQSILLLAIGVLLARQRPEG
ncbi:MAG: hypothetical protein ACUVTZ_04125 [Armatimonadota bacterium]